MTDPAKKADVSKVMPLLCKAGTIGTACPTAAIIGSCRVGKAYDATTAKAACAKGHGHWVD